MYTILNRIENKRTNEELRNRDIRFLYIMLNYTYFINF